MKSIDGYRVTVYNSKYIFDHAVFLESYNEAIAHVDDYIFDGFVVLCEEKRILVPDLSDDLASSKGMDPNTHCYCRDYLANHEVNDGMLSSNGRDTDR